MGDKRIKLTNSEDSLYPILDTVEVSFKGVIAANTSISIENNMPHAVFLVFVGTWTEHRVDIVFPYNSQLKIHNLANSAKLDKYEYSAYGTWGFNLREFSGINQPAIILKVKVTN